ncbi:MAG TPA: LptA/OstA family protein [Xanthobacteraceae bacterium]|jgi:lipopolysaccharide export system protein LptA|nr:LptA/OstA family protein [Xanthobacteraceae bacterium]
MSRTKQKFCSALAGLAVTALLAATPVAAQPSSGGAAQPSSGSAAPGPFQGMMSDQKKDQPVQIEAATLEVRDKNKTATFSGNVQVVQGDTTMKCQSLVVFYGQEIGIAGNGKPAATPVTTTKSTPGMPQGAQNIRRIEARGGVTVLTKDQNVKGDTGIYDLETKTITLSGNVVVSQGQNVIHGEKVVVDTVTGSAKVESGSSNGGAGAGAPGPPRVRALIQPGKGMTIGPGQTNSGPN